jgi:hypothetical protein
LLATGALDQARSPVVAAVVRSMGDLLVLAIAADKFSVVGLVFESKSQVFLVSCSVLMVDHWSHTEVV